MVLKLEFLILIILHEQKNEWMTQTPIENYIEKVFYKMFDFQIKMIKYFGQRTI